MNWLLLSLVVPALSQEVSSAPAAAGAAAPAAVAEAVVPEKKPGLFPPKAPARAKNSLDSAGEVARDLAAAVEYFEAGQAYYRAFTKGTHTAEENAAFAKFLEDYEKEQATAKRTHAALGAWLEKKSQVTD
ncbi:MAG: hypothetical protein SF051_14315 [Elusimicrobiota bacterium]|nr:hypothetical protein [Elusimicrobiota bacterium]